MAGFFHGIKTYQLPTAIVPPRRTMSALPVAFGCAPIHRLPPEARGRVMPGSLVMAYSLSEAGTALGVDIQRDDFRHWGLSEVAYAYFVLFNAAPVAFVNLFDPDRHKKMVADEEVALAGGKGRLQHPDLIGDMRLSPTMGGDPYVPGVDYAVNALTGEITVLDGGALASVDSVKAFYAHAAPELVGDDECIGGFDAETKRTTGISLVDEVFPRFREVPAIAIAPKFGENPVVAAILAAKMSAVNGLFKGLACVDIPSGADGVRHYTDVPAYKQRNNLVSEDLWLAWPMVKLGDRLIRLSVEAAARAAATDADNKDVPFVSPSNKSLQMTACALADGTEVWLDLQQANYLNGNGVATALNWTDGWKLWGNRTACYPDVTDPKDAFITGRRMMAWYGNRLTLTYWSKVDDPMGRRLVSTIVNSKTMNLNGLTAAGCLHGGRIQALAEENPVTDLIDGQFTFHVYLGLIPPAERLYFNLEYDTDYILAFFRGLSA